MTIDYGLDGGGVLRAGKEEWHTASLPAIIGQSPDVLADPGEQDITAHRNFTRDPSRRGSRRAGDGGLHDAGGVPDATLRRGCREGRGRLGNGLRDAARRVSDADTTRKLLGRPFPGAGSGAYRPGGEQALEFVVEGGKGNRWRAVSVRRIEWPRVMGRVAGDP